MLVNQKISLCFSFSLSLSLWQEQLSLCPSHYSADLHNLAGTWRLGMMGTWGQRQGWEPEKSGRCMNFCCDKWCKLCLLLGSHHLVMFYSWKQDKQPVECKWLPCRVGLTLIDRYRWAGHWPKLWRQRMMSSSRLAQRKDWGCGFWRTRLISWGLGQVILLCTGLLLFITPPPSGRDFLLLETGEKRLSFEVLDAVKIPNKVQSTNNVINSTNGTWTHAFI